VWEWRERVRRSVGLHPVRRLRVFLLSPVLYLARPDAGHARTKSGQIFLCPGPIFSSLICARKREREREKGVR
jgi:hypothetical protein